MRRVILNNEYSNPDYLKSLIDDFIVSLKTDKYKNHHKILELCHVAKFLSFFDDKYKIEKLNEGPDFIITSSIDKIGLEHQILVDERMKEKEGIFENIFKHAEKILNKESVKQNFLADIYVNSSAEIRINGKNQKINEIVELVRSFIKTNTLTKNSIIDEIMIMPHSQISLCPNFGAWYQKDVTPDLLINAISKKEQLIDNYIRKTNLKQWLLIVIGGLGESSYELENDFDVDIKSQFDKIYLMEDFHYRLYEIK